MRNTLIELYRHIRYWWSVDRIGPDIPLTHWCLYFKTTMQRLAQRKFLKFGLGAEFRPGAYAVACSKISIGNRVIIRPGCMLFADPRENGAGITIEDNVMIGSAVHFYVSNHIFDDVSEPIINQGSAPSKPINLRDGSWVGAGSIILPGVTIGRNAVVGAGSVVTRNVPDFSVVIGSPAKVVKTINRKELPEFQLGV